MVDVCFFPNIKDSKLYFKLDRIRINLLFRLTCCLKCAPSLPAIGTVDSGIWFKYFRANVSETFCGIQSNFTFLPADEPLGFLELLKIPVGIY